MGGRGCRLSKLFPVGGRTLCFFAGLKRQVARSKTNSDLLEEAIRRRASGKDPHKVIGKLADFPVNLDQMKAKLDFYNIENGCLPMQDGTKIKTAWLNHPQGCMGFRLETKEGVLVYATDNEPGDPNFDKAVRKLAEGADILIYDAQYLPEEYEARRRGWGHSHWREAVNVVMESGAKELILYHHDPDHSDAIVDKVVKDARNYYPKVRAAAEGLEILL